MKNNHKIKVTVIDDNTAFCEALKFFIEMHTDIQLTIYNSAISFLNEYNNKQTGFLLMDLFMPGIDGIALLEELQTRGNNMYTIIISGHADSAIASKVTALGANEFLSKPFNIDTLFTRIRSFNPI